MSYIWGYIRVSTDKQDRKNQKHGLLEYANKHGMTGINFTEETISSKIEDGIGYAVWSDQELSDAVKISRPSITRWRTGARSPIWLEPTQELYLNFSQCIGDRVSSSLNRHKSCI